MGILHLTSKMFATKMIRNYRNGDHVAIAEIFSQAVHEIAREVYSKDQCNAWASGEINYPHWKKRCELKRPFISQNENKEIEGFLELDTNGHIDCAYVNPKYKRQGVMTRLTEHAIRTCFEFSVDRIFVEASICIMPMFEKLGFQIIREKMVRIGEEELKNYDMELIKSSANKSVQATVRAAPDLGGSLKK